MLVAMKCPMCGGEVTLSSDMKIGKCEYCGSPVIVSKNMGKIGNLYNLATFYRQTNEFDRSIETYKDILKEDSEDAEAYFGLAMSKYGIEFVEDPKSHERVPTFHRTKEKSILIDPDYIKALEYADLECRSYYQTQGQKIALIQNEIIKSANTASGFDVFICYKESDESGNRTEESTIGQELYYELKKLDIKTFFARLTLKPGEEYEPVIFSALRTAKVMLVLGCNPQNYNSVWVKNEWSRFLELRENDHSKTIIPCYKNCSPYELPKELTSFQALDISKIGFLQDVVSGIQKIVNSDTDRQQTTGTNSDINRLCKNARTFYELGQKDKAEQIYKELTNDYPDDYRGWWGYASVETNEFKLYTPEVFDEIAEYAGNALKVAKESERAEIKPIWDEYLRMKNRKDSAEKKQRYTLELSELKRKTESYERKYQSDENKLPALRQKRSEQQKTIRELEENRKKISEPKAGVKVRKAGITIGTVFAIAVVLLGIPGAGSLGGVLSMIIGGIIMGAIIVGIAYAAAGSMDSAVRTKNRMVRKDLDDKWNKITPEFRQIDREIQTIETRKKEYDDNCSRIRNLEEQIKKLS